MKPAFSPTLMMTGMPLPLALASCKSTDQRRANGTRPE